MGSRKLRVGGAWVPQTTKSVRVSGAWAGAVRKVRVDGAWVTIDASAPPPFELISVTRGTPTENASLVITAPAVQPNDLIVAVHGSDFYTAAGMLAPVGTLATGWTLTGTADAGSNRSHIKVWWHRAAAAGSLNVSLPKNSDAAQHGYVMVLRNARVARAQTGAEFSATPSAPAILADAGGMVASFWICQTNLDYNLAGSGQTEGSQSTYLTYSTMTIGTVATPSAATVGPFPASAGSTARWHSVFTLALAPEAV